MTLEAVLFDLDNTLYPVAAGMMDAVGAQIHHFVGDALGLELAAAETLCREYYGNYGLTLHGLRTHHPIVDVDRYLAFIHDVPIETLIVPHPALREALMRLPLRRFIFTNSVQPYADRVLAALGIADQFEQVFDLRFCGLLGKPHLTAYQQVLQHVGVPGAAVALVEDVPFNLPPAKTLGMTTVLVDETGQHTSGADIIAPNIVAAVEAVSRHLR